MQKVCCAIIYYTVNHDRLMQRVEGNSKTPMCCLANWEKGIVALIANMYCCRLEEGEKSIVLQSFTEGGGQPAYLWVQF